MSTQELVVTSAEQLATDPITIDVLYLDLTTCDRCLGTAVVHSDDTVPATYELPENLQAFFGSKGEQASEPSSCCSADEQASCCEPSAKASCCGESADGGCRCR